MSLRQNEWDDKHVSVRLIISKTLFFNHRLFIIFLNTVFLLRQFVAEIVASS